MNNFFRIKNTWIDLVYIKPYLYISPYVNGILTGYFIETDYWNKSKDRNNRICYSIKNIDKLAKSILLLFIILIPLFIKCRFPSIFYPIVTSTFPTVISVIFCYSLLENNFSNLTRSLLSSKLWVIFRDNIRVSYLIHIIVFWFTHNYLTITEPSVPLILIHFMASLTLNYIISLLIHKYIEKPIINCFEIISQFCFNFFL